MKRQASPWKGILAGVVGGLAAAWMMNLFAAGPGQALQEAMASDEENREQELDSETKEDATMKAADALTHTVTGQHLSRNDKETGGPLIHYAFGALTGGLYGGLAEVIPSVTAGFGTSFGAALFSTADLLAVPALKLGPWPTDQPKSSLPSPFAAHIVYGATTELVRRIARTLL